MGRTLINHRENWKVLADNDPNNYLERELHYYYKPYLLKSRSQIIL